MESRGGISNASIKPRVQLIIKPNRFGRWCPDSQQQRLKIFPLFLPLQLAIQSSYSSSRNANKESVPFSIRSSWIRSNESPLIAQFSRKGLVSRLDDYISRFWKFDNFLFLLKLKISLSLSLFLAIDWNTVAVRGILLWRTGALASVLSRFRMVDEREKGRLFESTETRGESWIRFTPSRGTTKRLNDDAWTTTILHPLFARPCVDVCGPWSNGRFVNLYFALRDHWFDMVPVASAMVTRFRSVLLCAGIDVLRTRFGEDANGDAKKRYFLHQRRYEIQRFDFLPSFLFFLLFLGI